MLEVQFLALHVAAILWRIHVGGATVPVGAPWDRHLKGRIQQDAEVPMPSKLRAMKKHAVEQQDRVRQRLLGHDCHFGVRAVIETRRPVVERAARTQRLEKVGPERRVVEGISKVSLRGASATPVPHTAWVMKGVDRCTDNRQAATPERIDELVRECGLAHPVDAIDRYADRMRTHDAGNSVSQHLEQSGTFHRPANDYDAMDTSDTTGARQPVVKR